MLKKVSMSILHALVSTNTGSVSVLVEDTASAVRVMEDIVTESDVVEMAELE